MNRITPETIAAIASRIYNEVPGASGVPKSEAGMTPSSIAQLGPPPTFPTTGPGFPLPGAIPIGSINGRSPLADGAARPSLPSELPQMPGDATSAPPGFATVDKGSGLPNDSGLRDGVRAFVDMIRSSGLQSQTGPFGSTGRSSERPGGGELPASSTMGLGARPLDVPAIRRDFPILRQLIHGKPLAWLDNAATTQKPQCVIDAISNFYESDNSNIHRGAHTLAARATDAFEQARQKAQTFLGASSSKEIIFVRGTTEGINLVANTYGKKFLQPGDEIILSTLEHHANIVPWQMVAQQTGARIRVVPVNDHGEIMLEHYQALLGPRTRFVSLTHASNSLGTILPIAEMTQMAKRYNARVLIDGAQTVAHTPVNVQQLDADFFVFSGHKIFAPTGIGVVYVKQEMLEIMPPWQGGGNMIKNVTFEETTYAEPPAKFEAGTPTIADAVGLGAALDYVSRLGLPNISKYEHQLLEYATEQLVQIPGLRLIGTAREKVGVLSFVLKERRTEDVGRLLDLEGIAVRAGHHCSQPSLRRFGLETTVRPSLAFYNTHDEIDRLTAAIKRILRL